MAMDRHPALQPTLSAITVAGSRMPKSLRAGHKPGP